MAVIMEAFGGVGNQLFRYATAYCLARETNRKVVIKRRDQYYPYGLDAFNIPQDDIIQENVFPADKDTIYADDDYLFKHHLIDHSMPNHPVVYLNGIYESEIWFDGPYKDDLIKILDMKPMDLSPKLQEIKTMMDDTISVSVHVRRGDMKPDNGWWVETSFHRRMMAHIKTEFGRQGHVQFFIFSDDVDLIRDDFRDFPDVIFVSDFTHVDGNTGRGQGTDGNPMMDFYLMRCCHHFIQSWSTFSWWASYLAPYKEKRIMVAERFVIPDRYPHLGQGFESVKVFDRFYQKYFVYPSSFEVYER